MLGLSAYCEAWLLDGDSWEPWLWCHGGLADRERVRQEESQGRAVRLRDAEKHSGTCDSTLIGRIMAVVHVQVVPSILEYYCYCYHHR